MSSEIGIFSTAGNRRSQIICNAMHEGLRRVGVKASLLPSTRAMSADVDVAIFYGLAGHLRDLFDRYRRDPAKRAVYIDLGFWGRRDGGKYNGYHKVAVDCRHPLAYFQRRRHSNARAAKFGVAVKPWRRDGRHILIAGMGPKACMVEGFNPTEWESMVVDRLRKITDRPLIYRPKPNYMGARPIRGAVMKTEADQSLEEALKNSWAVVAHHSNVCIDALAAGIPVYCADGLALALGRPMDELKRIEKPEYPDGREQFIADVAYTQWNVREMAEGRVWRYLIEEGVI